MNRLLLIIGLLVMGAPTMASAQTPPSAEPGAEHDFIHALAGNWSVWIDDEESGTVTGRLRMGGLFVELELRLGAGPIQHAVYLLGFDQRNDTYTISAIDNTGSYAVHASGPRDGSRAVLYGVDDDPTFRQMGIAKEFAYVLEVAEAEAAIEIRFIDTRTDERTEIPFLRFELRRSE